MNGSGYTYIIAWVLLLLSAGIVPGNVYCQTIETSDTTSTKVSFHKTDSTAFQRDTIQDQNEDVSPLDISGTRGLFILSADRMLQLRILGSIRTSINWSDEDLGDKQTFNPYEIPTNVENWTPNFFAGLQQTRLGIEVTRRTKSRGDIFIRFEGDFKNSSNTFRIRHAYGQMGGFLVGQTWSLMNNVSFQPAIVSLDGPACGSGLRTPQIRYSRRINNKLAFAAALEYSSVDLELPDSLNISLLQVIPNLTGRLSYSYGKLSFRFSMVLATISGRVNSEDISYAFGIAGSLAGRYKIKSKSELFFSLFGGRATSHFLDMFNGKNQDMAFDINTKTFKALNTYAGYVAFEQALPLNLSSSVSFGMAMIPNKDFQKDEAYNYSYNALLNIFWAPVDGARVGVEYANGQRFDKGPLRGMANRVSMLIYYDF
jgi:hypothetical protein